MIRFELLRMLKSRFVWISAAVLTIYYVVITGFITGGSMNSARNMDKRINTYLSQFDEKDDDTLIETLQNETSKLSEFVFEPENADRVYTEKGHYGETIMEDYSISANAAELARYLLRDYPQKMTETVNRSGEMLASPSQNEYTIKEHQKIIAQYNRVRHFELRSSQAAETWLSMQSNYIYLGALLMLAILMISAECFTCEYSRGMDRMVFAAPNGRLKLFFAKLLAVTITASAIVLIYAAADVFTSICYMGSEMLGEPLQRIPAFQGCPFSITIFGYIIVKHALLLLLLFTSVGVGAFVCSFIKRSFTAMTISVLPFAMGIFVWIYMLRRLNDVFVSERLSHLRLWLPICFIDVKYYFEKFDCVDFCGTPTERLTVCVAVSALIFVFTTMFAAFRYGKPDRLKG